MARLCEDSDEEFPMLSVMINRTHSNKPSLSTKASSEGQAKTVDSHSSKKDENRKSSKRSAPKLPGSPVRSFHLESNGELVPGVGNETPKRRQRLLIASHDDSLLQPLSRNALESSRKKLAKATPKQTARADALEELNSIQPVGNQLEGNTIDYELHVHQRLEEQPSTFSKAILRRKSSGNSRANSRVSEGTHSTADGSASQNNGKVPYVIDLTSPTTFPHALGKRKKALQLPGNFSNKQSAVGRIYEDSSCEEDPLALLKFSPPRSTRVEKVGRVLTPPPGPSQSHSRTKSSIKNAHLPPSTHRQSSDLFWDQEFNDEWTNKHSPTKVSRSLQFTTPRAISEGENITPEKRSRASPGTKARGNADVKKAFNKIKHELARDFLKELDDRVTGGQIASMTAPAGGVQIIWSKKLNTTAGRANWKKERVTRHGDSGFQANTYRHIASIELSEKVIDDESRLLNTLSHEYCHLANFIIGGIRDRPHGREFQEWAKKCTQVFGYRGVEVTTKHSYAINFKYIWECTNCGTQFKRHSKSVDPKRHTCGSCKSKLVQIQPVPRTTAPSEYQLFVKDHFKEMKKAHPFSPQKDIMSLLGAAYKTRMGEAAKLTANEVVRSSGEEEKATNNELNSMIDMLDGLDIRGS